MDDVNVDALKQVWRRIRSRFHSKDKEFAQKVFCHCVASGTDPDVFCDKIESAMFRRAYESTKNPLIAWHAYAMFRALGRKIPDWVLTYFDNVAVTITQQAQAKVRDDIDLKAALGITDLRQAASYADMERTITAIAELHQLKQNAYRGGIGEAYRVVAKKYNISVEGLKKWEKRYAEVIELEASELVLK